MMAGLLFASCDKTNDPNNNVSSGELETSYIAVSVNSVFDPAMRADDATYEDGTAEEQNVTTAHFFFFDGNKQPFALNETTLGNQTALNYVVKNIKDSGNEEAPNVETITNVILTIQNQLGNYPTQMVAVLNWDYNGKSLTLDELSNTLADYAAAVTNKKGFLMSNSAYVKGTNTVITATPITLDNIASSAIAAEAAPVEIYVERVAAKVTVNTKSGTNPFLAKEDAVGSTDIYAKVVGWDLNTTIDKSYLVKHIDATWQNGTLGFTWNDEPYYRSYWAQTATGNYATNFTYESLSNEVGKFDYCLENINDSKRTQVVIATELYTDEACTQKAQIARLYSDMYLLDDLKTVIANALADNYFYKADETTYKSIEASDIDLVAAGNSGKDSYTVKYILSTQGETRDWYYTDDAGKTYTQKTDVEMNEYLATLEGAQVWNGMSYYMVDIEHLGNNSITNYGVVRNHSYVITVEGISGLGTPVYDPTIDVTEPTEPSETSSYVAARINVLSWRIVNQNVTLQ